MKRRFLISIFVFSFLTLTYSVLFVILMRNFEGKEYTIVDGVYWVLTTITTVGYGDIHFTTPYGRMFSVIVMLSGVLFFFGFLIPYVVIPWAERRLLLVLPREVKGLRRHVIVCGYNRFTKELCSIMSEFGIRYLVMEIDADRVREAIERGVKCVLTDNSLDSFRSNGVENAIAVVIAWENVETAIDTLLSLRDVETRKYVIHGDRSYTRYFVHAGASKVFLPKNMIASTIARGILGEEEVGKMKEILPGLYVVEAMIPARMKVGDLRRKNVQVIAVCKAGVLSFNPPDSLEVEKGSMALIAGSRESIRGVLCEGSHLRIW